MLEEEVSKATQRLRILGLLDAAQNLARAWYVLREVRSPLSWLYAAWLCDAGRVHAAAHAAVTHLAGLVH